MHISKIELENIKSHVSSTFEFKRGTTVITGANGAGKTTIIEAIAWTLFDLIEYKKEDFVRRGAKRGSVRITFISGLDEREYVIYRDSTTAYHVTDPRLQIRIAEKKDEVTRFLWQHLGLDPGTDLRSLFRQAIGVPQGTFTAIFLEGAAERKTAFDKLLKVEEYRQAAEKLRDTIRFLDTSIADVRERMARAEGELARANVVAEQHAQVSEQVSRFSAELSQIDSELELRKEKVAGLDAKEKLVADLNRRFDTCRSDRDKNEIVRRTAEAALRSAVAAAGTLDRVRDDHERHVAALARTAELEEKRERRDKLSRESAQLCTQIATLGAERARIGTEVEAMAAARAEIEALRPKAAEQERLEAALQAMRDRLAKARVATENVERIEARLAVMRERYRENQTLMKAAESHAVLAGTLPELETRDRTLIARLATLRARLEHDQKFQEGVRDGLCPVFSQRCLNLKPGETLEAFLVDQFDNLKSEITSTESERKSIEGQLSSARAAESQVGSLDSYRRRDAELLEEAGLLKTEKASYAEALKDAAEVEAKLRAAEAELARLENPSATIKVLEKKAIGEDSLLRKMHAAEEELAAATAANRRIEDALKEFAGLDETFGRLSGERDATAEAHRLFITNEADASTRDARQAEFDTAQEKLEASVNEMAAAEKQLCEASAGYDAESHLNERVELLAVERKAAETRATLEAAERRQSELSAEIERFAALQKELNEEYEEKMRLERVVETTRFIRETLKEAAPRVARNYVHHVSLEANQMFREITGNGERTLKWTDDYSVTLEEDGHERPFISLSGGEQMSAALSIRLALLKQLSDVRIAFFDEPTTNMDPSRRENFAQQISRVSHFDQLFIISHDETFDSYVDTVMSLD
jgi:exonuclease SbcC